MPLTDPASWSDRLQRTLQRYDEPLLRQVAGRLCRPRNHWPAEDLIQRSVNTIHNAPVLDRRLADLEPAARQALALIARSRQPFWPVGGLIETLVALGQPDGLRPILDLLHAGLLCPDLPLPEGGAPAPRLKDFEQWLTTADGARPTVFAHPLVTARLAWEDLALPECPGAVEPRGEALAHEADGLDWPLRLAVLWQQVAEVPLRRTQQGGFFKRDLERLRADALLNAAAPDSLMSLPDAALLAVELAVRQGLLREADGELRAGAAPPCWEEGLPATIARLWADLLRVEGWNVLEGQASGRLPGNPYPSVYLLALLLLGQLPAGGWARPAALEDWTRARHPYWQGARGEKVGVEAFLLGLAAPLRLIEATPSPQPSPPGGEGRGKWAVRLSALGRWLLGLGEAPPLSAYPQTLLVQPNLEILAYRQGLSPALIARLARLATWKGLGPACTLQLQPESVYRALEAGESFESILQALQRHSMKAVPEPVVNSLRTWASKRERIHVYAAAALFEFTSAEDLDAALARGLPALRLSERLAVVAREDDIDYRHFRLTATRDYALPPEKCVEVEADGVTLGVDGARSDLLVETEVRRFAEPLERVASNGRLRYRLTPASVAAARAQGLTAQELEAWFVQRSGQGLPAAARLLLAGPLVPPLQVRRLRVLSVPSAEIADGLEQWPDTRALLAGRLGPTALVVAEEHLAKLRARLEVLGITINEER